MGIKWVAGYHIRLWKWFLNFSIIMIWGSVFLSLITDVLPSKAINFFSFRLGGGHGDYVKNFLANNLGSLGAWIVVLATAVFYLMYLTSETVTIVRRMMHPQDYIKKLPRRVVTQRKMKNRISSSNCKSPMWQQLMRRLNWTKTLL